jgi:hypothetical protein
MSTDSSSELVAYHAFVKSMLSKGGSIDEDATPQAFLEYQRQFGELRSALQPAADRFKRGDEAHEIDVDQLVENVLQNGSHQSDRQ